MMHSMHNTGRHTFHMPHGSKDIVRKKDHNDEFMFKHCKHNIKVKNTKSAETTCK